MSDAALGSGDGNTESSPAPKNTQKKYWLITLPCDKPDSESVERTLRKFCCEYNFQLEKGLKTGYLHWQIFLKTTCKRGLRLTALKKYFPTGHFEYARNIDASYDYCQKNDETFVGYRTYYPRKIDDPFVSLNLQYKDWQKKILKILSEKPDNRKIYWFWENVGGTGKSTFSKHLVLTKNNCIVVNGKKDNILYAVTQSTPEIIIIDIARSQTQVSYDAIEDVKNGLFFNGKYESAMHVQNSPHVIIFANMPPDESKLSKDRWIITEL